MKNFVLVIVDGDPSRQQLFQNSLRDDYQVICTSSGRKAIELIQTKNARIAFVSYELPDMTGFEVLLDLRKTFPFLPIIMTAETPSKKIVLKAFRNKANDFLEIPFEKNELIQMIRRAANFPQGNVESNRPELSNSQKKKKYGIRFKGFVNHIWANFRKNKISYKNMESESISNSKDQILKAVSDEEESIIIENITMATSEEAVNIYPSRSELKAYFLGNFHIELNNRIIDHWPSQKGKQILAYLLYNHKKRIYRDRFMAKFWPDSPQDCAKNSLNVALHGIRKMFGEIDPGRDCILFKDDSYFINPEIETWLDIDEFMHHWKVGRSKDQMNDIPAMLKEYKLAASLYKGDFIEEDLYVDWMNLERENLFEIYLTILERLSYFYSINSKPLTAITLCERILSKDNCREDIHRRLMKCFYRLGQRDKAIKQFRKCVTILNSELDVDPTKSTLQLYEKIKNDSLAINKDENLQLSDT